jgi:hypothetical protein
VREDGNYLALVHLLLSRSREKSLIRQPDPRQTGAGLSKERSLAAAGLWERGRCARELCRFLLPVDKFS